MGQAVYKAHELCNIIFLISLHFTNMFERRSSMFRKESFQVNVYFDVEKKKIAK